MAPRKLKTGRMHEAAIVFHLVKPSESKRLPSVGIWEVFEIKANILLFRKKKETFSISSFSIILKDIYL